MRLDVYHAARVCAWDDRWRTIEPIEINSNRTIMDSSASTALQGCVSSLRTSMQLLESSINTLDAGVHDYPRLSKVLQTTRVRCFLTLAVLADADNQITALRTSLRTLPPNRPTNPPLLPRTRAQHPSRPRRSTVGQNGTPRTVAYRQSRSTGGQAVESIAGWRQEELDIGRETEHRWGWWTEQFGAVEG